MSHSVRLDDESYETLTDYARREDRPLARVLRAAVAAYQPGVVLERAGASPAPPRVPGVVAARRQDEREQSCGHPRGERKQLKWGTVCGACGAKL
jgi:hypothetical protein